ncbi:MAG: ribonuclease III [Fervidobacterium sp.]|nr:ribonuclease III [Fervidobacterium sp.]MBP9518091.1 ribonuclease III [Fervidobacterium sp.]
MSNDTLAYLGDAVFNLYAKLYVLADTKVQKVHSVATMLVSRQGQSKILSNILNLLNEKEKEVVRRGINSKGARKHGNDRQYMESTGLETLIGYLYLIDKERLSFLLKEGMAAWKEV